jgi:hypothetical protein
MYGMGKEGTASGAGIVDNYRYELQSNGVYGTNFVDSYLFNLPERYPPF